MSKTTIGLVAVAVCGVAFGVAAWVVPMFRIGDKPADPAPQAAAQPKAEAVKWEYCTFWREIGSGPQAQPQLLLPGKRYDMDLKALCRELKYDTTEQSPTATDVLNALGRDGWELFNYSERVQGNFLYQTWIFKRPVRA